MRGGEARRREALFGVYDDGDDGDGGVYKLYYRKQVGLEIRWLKSGYEERGRCDVIL